MLQHAPINCYQEDFNKIACRRRRKAKIKLFRKYFGHWRSRNAIITMQTSFYFGPQVFWFLAQPYILLWSWRHTCSPFVPNRKLSFDIILVFGAELYFGRWRELYFGHWCLSVFRSLARIFILVNGAHFILVFDVRHYFGILRMILF